MIQERLSALREEMKKRKIDIYIVPTADFHESEYVGEHFKKVYHRFYRIGRHSGHYPDRGRTVDRRTLFCAGGKTACWKYRDALPHG